MRKRNRETHRDEERNTHTETLSIFYYLGVYDLNGVNVFFLKSWRKAWWQNDSVHLSVSDSICGWDIVNESSQRQTSPHKLLFCLWNGSPMTSFLFVSFLITTRNVSNRYWIENLVKGTTLYLSPTLNIHLELSSPPFCVSFPYLLISTVWKADAFLVMLKVQCPYFENLKSEIRKIWNFLSTTVM